MNHSVRANELRGKAAFRIGACIFEPHSRALWVRGEQVALEPRLGALLEILVSNPGIIIPREQLLDTIWGQSGSDEALTQAVSRLRRALDDASAIKTIPRIGYQFECMPELVSQETLAAEAPSMAEAKKLTIFSRRIPDVLRNAASLKRLDLRSAFVGSVLGAALTTVIFLTAFEKQVTMEIEETIDGQTTVTVSQATCSVLADCD